MVDSGATFPIHWDGHEHPERFPERVGHEHPERFPKVEGRARVSRTIPQGRGTGTSIPNVSLATPKLATDPANHILLFPLYLTLPKAESVPKVLYFYHA